MLARHTTVVLSPDDPGYPSRLRDLPRPPRHIWARGNLAILDLPCVAIVGTRQATPYAERVTRELARCLSQAGACVISGLARGVDSVAHRSTLESNGATCAVLGTGLDVVYPKANAHLQSEIAMRGLLLSERRPGDPAHKGSFPNRNRIIAALASATIVVEAGLKSGALLTSTYAADLGRSVAAIPGPIDVPQSLGSNELLRDGATTIASLADALALMGLTKPMHVSQLPQGGAERSMWDALNLGTADLDTLCTRSGLPAHQGMAAVTALELLGLIECSLSGEVRRI